MPEPIHITVYRGARDHTPIGVLDGTWDEIADEIEAMTREVPLCPADAGREEQKLAMLAFAPHRLREPVRALRNVEAVTLGVLDVDKVADLEGLIAAAQALCEHGLIYESPSSTPDAPRVRIVAPVSRPVAVAECRYLRFAFAEALGIAPKHGVEGAKDAAKIFFAGVHFGDEPRRVWRW